MTMAVADILDTPAPEWDALARRARTANRLRTGLLVVFLSLVSLPIILPYLWMVVISFSARTGGVESGVLWRVVAVLAPAVILLAVALMTLRARRLRLAATVAIAALAAAAIWIVSGSDLHLQNYRFLVNPNVIEDMRGKATAGGQFPWVWNAFFNSLFVAGISTAVKATAATLAGYYLSRFAFPGRAGYLQGLLVIEAFPPMILTIPIFIVVYWIGLINTLPGPMLVISALDLPFYIFVMKGFFDGVPWDIEMSALTDGATRRQAFLHVVLPQVTGGIIAISIFAFIKGWEEYVFVTSLRTGNSYWVMSTYLYYIAQDVMGVDYGMVAAVSVIYVIPSLLLYLFFQKYLTQMTFGGVKG
ncbi:MAG: carbohydrate ABC transporter permease [Rhodobiaceae bacterium]|nr:carbohydrate ABC transporter permease [Rhodobiaceae bacterium]